MQIIDPGGRPIRHQGDLPDGIRGRRRLNDDDVRRAIDVAIVKLVEGLIPGRPRDSLRAIGAMLGLSHTGVRKRYRGVPESVKGEIRRGLRD